MIYFYLQASVAWFEIMTMMITPLWYFIVAHILQRYKSTHEWMFFIQKTFFSKLSILMQRIKQLYLSISFSFMQSIE